MTITVLKNNVPWGPFTRAQIDEGLARGDFTLQCPAHAPGLKDWLPLGEVLHHVELSTQLPPLPASLSLPAVPGSGGSLPRPPALPISTGSRRLPEGQLAPPIVQPVKILKPAPFIPRALAFVIDCAILFVPVVFLFGLGALTVELQSLWEKADHESTHQEWELLRRNFVQLFWIVAIGFAWLYAAGLECSRRQATVGKIWMGIKVTDAQGERIGFFRATGRHLAKYISAVPCFLGFFLALFSPRGRALHDRLANTRVVRARF